MSRAPNNPPATDTDTNTNTGSEPPHRAADDTEQVYFHGSPALRGEVGRLSLFLLGGLLLTALSVLAWALTWGFPWPVHVALWVGATVALLWPWILSKTIKFRISNYRIDFERGIFTKRIDTLELWHVDDIRFYQSFIDRILNVGTIAIISGDRTTPEMPIRGIPNPRPIFETLKQRIISVKRQRGVIKMDHTGGEAAITNG